MAFVKDMIRMWLRSWKRFVSIAMITLLGVAVLTGIVRGMSRCVPRVGPVLDARACMIFRCCRRLG